MAENPFKVGLLGLGFMGRRHLDAYRSLPGVEVLTRTSARFAHLQDPDALYEAMIGDRELDALDICLPTALHAPLTIAALDAGKHVLCEKPMALTVEACGRMLEARKRNKGVLMVAHVLRFWPAYRVLHEAVARFTYGAIRSARFARRSGLPGWGPWLLRPEESGGAPLDLLVHDYDQALWLFGAPESATARTVGSDNVIACSLRYPGGLEVAIDGGWYPDDIPFAMEFDLQASQGELRYANDHLQLLRPPAAPTEIALSNEDPYATQIAYFLDCCRNGRAPVECPPESSAQAVELALSISALAQGTPKQRERRYD
jgi:predicted dehydrogenase